MRVRFLLVSVVLALAGCAAAVKDEGFYVFAVLQPGESGIISCGLAVPCVFFGNKANLEAHEEELKNMPPPEKPQADPPSPPSKGI